MYVHVCARMCVYVSKKANAQHESCELGFIWGKMRTIARETALQIALGSCSKEVAGKVSVHVILGQVGTGNQAHIFAEGSC